MVGLLPDRPQRGRSGITNLARVATEFEAAFAAHCRDVPHGRVTARIDRGKMVSPSAVEILTLGAALVAVSGLTPSTSLGIAGVSDGRGRVTVKVRAPAP